MESDLFWQSWSTLPITSRFHDYEGNDDYYEELGSIQRVDTIFS